MVKSELVGSEIRRLPGCRVIGRGVRHCLSGAANPVPAFWSECFRTKMFEALLALSPRQGDYVGYCCDYDRERNDYLYLAGMIFPAGTPVPKEFTGRDIPEMEVCIACVKGVEPGIYGDARILAAEAAGEAGRMPNRRLDLEVYNSPRFTEPDSGGRRILDLYIGVQ